MKIINMVTTLVTLTTAIHGRKYRVSSDPRSQAAAGMESIRAGDHLRTPYAVVSFLKGDGWVEEDGCSGAVGMQRYMQSTCRVHAEVHAECTCRRIVYWWWTSNYL